MKRFLSLICLALACMVTSPSFAQRATLPAVLDAAGNPIMATGVICVDLAGAYTGCGGAGSGASANQVQGTAASGAAPIGNPVQIGVSDGSAIRTLSGDSAGRANVTINQGGNIPTVGTLTGDGVASPNSLAVRSYGLVFNGSLWDRMRGDTTGSYVVSKGGSSLATGQVSVTTASTLVAAARAGRNKITMTVGAANTCAFGNTGVTTTTGFPLAPTVGASLTLDTAAAIYAVCSATTTVSFIEQY